MNFKPELIAKILAGEKTQTRRPVKPGQWAARSFYPGDSERIVIVNQEFRGKVYGIFQEYAICPGRGKRHVARFKLLSIREEDVRNISDEDVKAEGFAERWEFFKVWLGFYDKWALNTIWGAANIAIHGGIPYGQESVELAESILSHRPDEKYRAWALTFELVEQPERLAL